MTQPSQPRADTAPDALRERIEAELRRSQREDDPVNFDAAGYRDGLRFALAALTPSAPDASEPSGDYFESIDEAFQAVADALPEPSAPIIAPVGPCAKCGGQAACWCDMPAPKFDPSTRPADPPDWHDALLAFARTRQETGDYWYTKTPLSAWFKAGWDARNDAELIPVEEAFGALARPSNGAPETRCRECGEEIDGRCQDCQYAIRCEACGQRIQDDEPTTTWGDGVRTHAGNCPPAAEPTGESRPQDTREVSDAG